MSYEPFTKKVTVPYNDVMSGSFFCPCCSAIIEVEKLKMPDIKPKVLQDWECDSRKPKVGLDRTFQSGIKTWAKP